MQHGRVAEHAPESSLLYRVGVQVPVHKFYKLQFADASLRWFWWRLYNVMPGMPYVVLIVTSLAWQAFLLTFSASLQVRMNRKPCRAWLVLVSVSLCFQGTKPRARVCARSCGSATVPMGCTSAGGARG